MRGEIPCPQCGTANPAGQKFCDGCSSPLVVKGGPTHRNEAAPREPRAYTPKHLADRILQSKSALEGERKQVTVLFADVKGSMELAERIGAEEWHAILDRFFQILTEGVHRFEGTVNQYTGDGIMALFGAPIAHEDHAQRACYAALHLSDELRSYANELRRSKGFNFSVRMGLNSGEVVVGKIGDDLRMDYTAQGHTVGLAARMEETAEPGKVYVTEHTAALVSGYFHLEDLGRFDVHGSREPVRVHELQGVGRLRTRLDVSRSRGFSRFVGRAEETQVLEAALARAEQGQPQIVGIIGEAGVGKSRLCFEFLERCRARKLMTYETHGVAHGKFIPLLPMLSLFRTFFGIGEQDSDATARERIAGRLLLLDEAFRHVLPLMFDFLGVADPEAPAPLMDPEARERQLIGAVRGVVQARAQRETTVVLLEDLHWFDGGSEAFLEPLLDLIPGVRTLIVVNFRPGYHAEWMQSSYYQQVPLTPLGPEAITELLRDLVGSDPSAAGLADLIRERTGGNPFFTEEMVQALVESGHLEGSKGAYRLTQPVEDVAVPETVQAVLAARIDRLAEREKQVLQSAAVIGKTFAEAILEQVVELPKPELADALHRLKNADFIYEQTLYPVAEYAFKHPLTHDVALQSQLQGRRRRVHAAIAQAIEADGQGRLDKHAALLAHHWEGAGEALIAARWHRRAAERVGLNQPAEGFSHWRKVRELLTAAPDSPESDELGAIARSQMIFVGARVGAAEEEMKELFREGSELARRGGHDAALARLSSSYGTFLYLSTGVLEQALGNLLQGVEFADRTNDLGLRIFARLAAAWSLGLGGHLEQALALTAEGVELCGEDHEVGADLWGASPWLGHRACRAHALSRAGRFQEAQSLLEDVLQSAPAPSLNPIYLALVHVISAERFRMLGDHVNAVDHSRQALEHSEESGSQPLRIIGWVSLGGSLCLAERWDEALPVLEHGLSVMRDFRTYLSMESQYLAALARATLGCGDLERAQETARAAVRIGKGNGWLPECEAQLTLAHVLLQSADPPAANEVERALCRAMELIDLSGARSREPLVHEERAKLAHLVGDEATRESKLREAHRLYTEMGATGHAERVARELGL